MRKSVETFAPLFSGFYDSIWDSLIDNYLEYEAEEQGLEYIENYSVNFEEYSKEITTAIDQALSELGLDIDLEFQSLARPREYNFETDSINVKLTLDFDKFISMVADKREEILPILKERYSDRDGFFSSHSNDYQEWFNDLLNNFEEEQHKVGAMLEILCEIEEVTTDDVVEAFGSNDGVGEYITF